MKCNLYNTQLIWFITILFCSVSFPSFADQTPRGELKKHETQVRDFAIEFFNKQQLPKQSYLGGKPYYKKPLNNVTKNNPDAWDLTFEDDLYTSLITVDGSRHIIRRFSRTSKGEYPAISANIVTKEDAIRRANQVLINAGIMDKYDLKLYKIKDWQVIANRKQWSTTWKRFYKGIQFMDEYSSVMLNAYTGEVDSFGIIANIPNPKNTDILIKEDTAVDTARALGKKQGITMDNGRYAALRIVLPNNYWLAKNTANNIDIPLRTTSQDSLVVWVVAIDSGDHHYQVWVDSASGKVVGGDLSIFDASYLKPLNKNQ